MSPVPYKVEDDIRRLELKGDALRDYRQKKAKPLVDQFCWTEEGADNAAVFQTLITSCLLAGIDPYKYLVDVLQRISLHPARNIRGLISRLWKEKFGAYPLKSDLDK